MTVVDVGREAEIPSKGPQMVAHPGDHNGSDSDSLEGL